MSFLLLFFAVLSMQKKKNLQSFSAGLLCSSAKLPEGGPGEAFSAALGRLQEGYSDRGTLIASQSAGL